TETAATGAPQKHHYTLTQQVGSITRELKASKFPFSNISFLLAIIILRVQHSNKLLLRTCRFIHPLPVLPFPEHSVHSGDKM
ncbi:hypothetical protein, partial [Klebsiella pneumoniae]|uniref:hypothetical protein n=1 Tax=Klebsiella pneumoniae TaxID=573 RepID=UPI0025A0BCA8